MNMKRTLLASTIVGMFLSATALAAGVNEAYPTFDEIHATPSMPTRAEQRMADSNDPYILYNEIVISEGCNNPVKELLADPYDPYVTFAELETARRNNKC